MDLLQVIPMVGNLGFTVVTFLVALLVIVAVHEFGHYIVARWTGIHAEVFSLGFGPVLTSRVDRHGTRWQIAAIPLGGYVRFMGDADAASATHGDISDLSPEEARRTMQRAPLWARTLTVAAGPAANFVLAIAVLSGLFMVQGIAISPLTVAELPPAPYEVGVEPGDVVLAIDGQKTPAALEDFSDYANQLSVEPTLDYQVRRGDQTLTVPGLHPYPAMVAAVTPSSASADAGLEIGDFILSVDGKPIAAFSDLKAAVTAAGGAHVVLNIWRDGQTFEQTMTPRETDRPNADGGFEKEYLIGIGRGLWFTPVTKSPGILPAIRDAAYQTWFTVKLNVSGVYHMAAGKISTCNMSSFVRIAEATSTMAAQGLVAYIGTIAFLSTAIGLLNLFPIPVLDGGHLVLYGYEAIFRRPPGDNALRIIMTFGLSVIVALMVFALSNDFLCV